MKEIVNRGRKVDLAKAESNSSFKKGKMGRVR